MQAGQHWRCPWSATQPRSHRPALRERNKRGSARLAKIAPFGRPHKAGLHTVTRTNADGRCGEEDEPEEREVAAQLERVEHHGGEHQRVAQHDDELLHHLEHQVRDGPVQTIVPLTARTKPSSDPVECRVVCILAQAVPWRPPHHRASANSGMAAHRTNSGRSSTMVGMNAVAA